MDSCVLQLEKSDCDFPSQLLLQYSYYLNKSATKEALIGFDKDSFQARVLLQDNVTKTVLEFTPENWEFVGECLESSSPECFGTTGDKIWNIYSIGESVCNEDRCIAIKNVPYDRKILFNREELTILLQYMPYLRRMLKHYNEKWGIVKQYYSAYLMKCFVADTLALKLKKFFKFEMSALNYFRLFNEIPVICRDKLLCDLGDLYSGNV